MDEADVIVDPAEIELDELSRDGSSPTTRQPTNRRNVEILTEFAQREPEGKPKRIVLRFLPSPVEIQGDGKVERIVIDRNELERDDRDGSAPSTPASARRSSAAWSCARSATRASRSTASPSTSAAA